MFVIDPSVLPAVEGRIVVEADDASVVKGPSEVGIPTMLLQAGVGLLSTSLLATLLSSAPVSINDVVLSLPTVVVPQDEQYQERDGPNCEEKLRGQSVHDPRGSVPLVGGAYRHTRQTTLIRPTTRPTAREPTA